MRSFLMTPSSTTTSTSPQFLFPTVNFYALHFLMFNILHTFIYLSCLCLSHTLESKLNKEKNFYLIGLLMHYSS